MRDFAQAAFRGAKSVLARRAMRIGQLVSPVEREFRRIWPIIDSMEGLLVSPIQERWLYEVARSLSEGAVIVEIGSYKGRSTACLAYGCRRSRKRVYSIDTFNGNETDFKGPGRGNFFDDWQRNISVNDLGKYVTPVIGDSRIIGKEWALGIDMLFIDGSHFYEDVIADFDNFSPHVVKGGIIAMHDVGSHSGPTRVWEERRYLLQDWAKCSTIAFGTKP